MPKSNARERRPAHCCTAVFVGTAHQGRQLTPRSRKTTVSSARLPVPAAGEDERAMAAAWIEGESPLLELRNRRGLKREAVVDALISALGLDPAKREKVKGYYHRLETGLLEPRGVDRRVFDVLAETLSAPPADVRSWRPQPQFAESAYMRRDAEAAPSRLHRSSPTRTRSATRSISFSWRAETAPKAL